MTTINERARRRRQRNGVIAQRALDIHYHTANNVEEKGGGGLMLVLDVH